MTIVLYKILNIVSTLFTYMPEGCVQVDKLVKPKFLKIQKN